MSQFILDEQLGATEVLGRIRKRLSVERLTDLRPGERILDDRIPEILLTVKTPTLLTMDEDFWDRAWCHADYAILFFPFSEREQELVPELLFDFLRLREFRSRAARMGKVIRLGLLDIQFWQLSSPVLHRRTWPRKRRRRKRGH